MLKSLSSEHAWSLPPLLALLLLVASACNGHTRLPYRVLSAPRTWSAHPAIAVVDQMPRVLLAVSDIHGGYQRFLTLLASNHVIEANPPAPDALRWVAADTTLVVIGDLVDKGPGSLETLDAVRTLEAQAEAAGGRVIVTLGNHEAEFLDDPENTKTTKSDGFAADLERHGLQPLDIADGSDPRGVWLRNLPFAVKVGGWFFAHGGNTKGRSVAALEHALRSAVDAQDYDASEIIGSDSLLEARGWYDVAATARRDATALCVEHLVFGHDPSALGPTGAIAVANGGLLLRIDAGMSPEVNHSTGKLLRVRVEGDQEIVESLDASGAVQSLWRGR